MTTRTEDYWASQRRLAMSSPIPARTDTYSPVSHAQIIQQMEQELRNEHLSIVRERTYVNRFGTRVVGMVTVEDGSNFGKDNGIKMMLAYRNSYDKSMAVGFAGGATVWICSNGCISGDMVSFRRKHTGSVSDELTAKIKHGIGNMRNEFGQINLEIDVMKNFDLTPRQKAEILGVMYFERNLVTPTQLSIVKRELVHSENFKENNAWSLYNNVTEALKSSHPVDVITDHIKFHRFMKDMCGITIEQPVADGASSPEAQV